MQQELQTEIELLQLLADGHRSAIERIYKQHYKYIAGYIRKNGGNSDDAGDICQEAIIVLYEKAQDPDFRLTCKINTYLFAVAKNLWLKQVNSNDLPVVDNNTIDESNVAYEDDIKAHHERELYYDQLEQALEQLGQPCSTLLKAYYYKEKSMQDIATLFKYTNADNAKTQKYKCLSRLKKLFYNAQLK